MSDLFHTLPSLGRPADVAQLMIDTAKAAGGDLQQVLDALDATEIRYRRAGRTASANNCVRVRQHVGSLTWRDDEEGS